MEKICFIINPKAGHQRYTEVIKKIKEKLDLKKYEYEIKLSKDRYDVHLCQNETTDLFH